MAKGIILVGTPKIKEADASGAITPGHLLERSSATEFAVHASAGQNAAPLFAVEAGFLGDDIDEAYADGERVYAHFAQPGDEVYALVAAAAPAIAVDDYLESAGDGTVRKVVASAATAESARASIIGRAIEAVDNSAGGTAVRIRVEVL